MMFDQANPDTPNDVIVEAIKQQKPALVGLQLPEHDQLSICQDARPADPRRRRHGQARVRRGVRQSECRPRQAPMSEVDFVCRGDGEQLLLDLLAQMDAPETVGGLTWMKDGHVMTNPGRPMERHLDQWPFPDRESLRLDFVESMPLDVPAVLSMERFTTMQTSRGCPGRVSFATFRFSMKANGGPAVPRMSSPSSSISKRTGMAPSILSTITFSSSRNALKRSAMACSRNI